MTDADSFFKALAFLNACIRFMENQVPGLKFKPFKPHAVDFKSMWCAVFANHLHMAGDRS